MSDSLELYELPLSHNSIKVRIALGFKGLAFERIPLDVDLDTYPGDRTAIVAASAQPLTPVLVHGERAIFDSAAILRYLEANFRATPRLFAEDVATMRCIEEWESFGRGELSAPLQSAFKEIASGSPDRTALQRASEALREATERIEHRLDEQPWLAGPAMSAADVTAAPVVYYSMLPEAVAETVPLAGLLSHSLPLGEGRPRTRAWAAKVMAYDH